MSTIMEEYKKEVETYCKNERAAKAIVALKRYAKKGREKYDVATLDVLLGNIVELLSDPDVKIGYKGDIINLNYLISDMNTNIYGKYNGKIERSLMPKHMTALYEDDSYYNLANILNEIIDNGGSYEDVISWINELLCSNMNIEKRLNFLLDLMKRRYIGLDNTICSKFAPGKLPHSQEKDIRKEELKNYIQSTPWINEKIVETIGADGILRYIEDGVIDLSSPETVKKAIELVKQHKSRSKDVYELMKSLRYQNNVSEEQKNDDILNIFAQADIRYIDYYTCFLEFDFDPEIMLIIAGLMRDNWNSIERPESLRDHLYKYFFEKQLDSRDDYEEYGKKFLEIVNDRETGAINETKARKDAQNRLIRVLTRTLNKTQEQPIGKISKSEDN